MKQLLKLLMDASVSVSAPLLQLRRRRLVLLYHDLHDPANLPSDDAIDYGMSVAMPAFERQLQWLRTFARVVSLDDLLQDRSAPANQWQVAITFDDAYDSVFTMGLPLLSAYDMPSTVFVPTWYIADNRRLPWWDLTAYATRHWPGTFAYSFEGEEHVYEFATQAGKTRFLTTAASICYNSSPGRLASFQQAIQAVLQSRLELPPNRLTTVARLAEAAQSPRLTIGSHGSRHYNAARGTLQELGNDIHESVELLQAWTQQQIRYYSYPYGKDASHSPDTMATLSSFGFRAAFLNDPGYLTDHIDPLQIPRLSVLGHWSPQAFKSRVLATDVRAALSNRLRKSRASKQEVPSHA